MKKMVCRYLVLVAALSLAFHSIAATGSGKVSQLIYYSSGTVLVKGINFGSEAGCNGTDGFFLP